jgi:membrane-associated phospholipid phosphatase
MALCAACGVWWGALAACTWVGTVWLTWWSCDYPLNHGSLCSVWCVVVCTSRLYLRMHSVADLVVILSSFNHGSLCSVWCVVVCTSRLYLGMHSVADLVVM